MPALLRDVQQERAERNFSNEITRTRNSNDVRPKLEPVPLPFNIPRDQLCAIMQERFTLRGNQGVRLYDLGKNGKLAMDEPDRSFLNGGFLHARSYNEFAFRFYWPGYFDETIFLTIKDDRGGSTRFHFAHQIAKIVLELIQKHAYIKRQNNEGSPWELNGYNIRFCDVFLVATTFDCPTRDREGLGMIVELDVARPA